LPEYQGALLAQGAGDMVRNAWHENMGLGESLLQHENLVEPLLRLIDQSLRRRQWPAPAGC